MRPLPTLDAADFAARPSESGDENAALTALGDAVRFAPADVTDEAAVQAATLSPYGVDLNFGCPAKTVNKSGGGAMLLADPGRAYLPAEGLQPLVRHAVATSLELEDRTLREVTIHRLLP